MSAKEIGRVKSEKSYKTYAVLWDVKSAEVYVKDLGGFPFGGNSTKCPTKSGSAGDAMRVAEAFVYNK